MPTITNSEEIKLRLTSNAARMRFQLGSLDVSMECLYDGDDVYVGAMKTLPQLKSNKTGEGATVARTVGRQVLEIGRIITGISSRG